MSASPGMARATVESEFRIDVRPILPTITAPTLVIHARDDAVPVQGGRYPRRPHPRCADARSRRHGPRARCRPAQPVLRMAIDRNRALRRSSIAHRSRGSGGVAQPREDDHPTGVLLRGVAGCPAPTAIAEQLHAQHGRVQAGPCQPPVGVVGRSVGEGRSGTSGSDRPPSRRRWRHSRSCDTHRRSPTRSTNSPGTLGNPRNPPRAPDSWPCEARRATNATPPV